MTFSRLHQVKKFQVISSEMRLYQCIVLSAQCISCRVMSSR